MVKKKKYDEKVDIEETSGGMSETRFGVDRPPENLGTNIKIITPEMKEEWKTKSPQQLLEEEKQRQFEAGKKTGEFGSLFSEKDINKRLTESGQKVLTETPMILSQGNHLTVSAREGEIAPLEIKRETLTDQIAKMGAFVPVTAANTISKGLKMLGVHMGELTTSEFTNTYIGKQLGLAIATAEAAGIISYGTTLVGAGGVKGLVGANLIKGKIGIGKLALGGLGLFSVNKLAGIPQNVINTSKQAMAGTIQTAGLIEDSVKLGAMTPQEAFNAFQELEAQLIELEKNINVWAARNYKNWIDGGKDNLVDIRNARLQLQLKRQALIAAISKPQNI